MRSRERKPVAISGVRDKGDQARWPWRWKSRWFDGLNVRVRRGRPQNLSPGFWHDLTRSLGAPFARMGEEPVWGRGGEQEFHWGGEEEPMAVGGVRFFCSGLGFSSALGCVLPSRSQWPVAGATSLQHVPFSVFFPARGAPPPPTHFHRAPQLSGDGGQFPKTTRRSPLRRYR